MADLEAFQRLEALRVRPEGRVAMVQSWRSLAFLHRKFAPDAVQGLLPDGLKVETFPDSEGICQAWVGLVLFTMHGIRLRGLPAVPGVSAFHETNVRTYARDRHGTPGVWFFSLDASNQIAVWAARLSFGLPYFNASMSVRVEGDRVEYSSVRPRGAAVSEVSVLRHGNPAPAKAESFEFWLIERYLLFAVRHGRLYSGQVHHPPYQIQPATVESCSTGLLGASSLGGGPAGWDHVCFSPGVDTEIFSTRRVDAGNTFTEK